MHRAWKWSAIPEHSYAFCWCGEKLATVEAHAAHVVSKLTDAGYSIVSHTEIREMIGPSREVDDCPQCNETVAWERNDYDLRDNDDHRYSWRAYCETCNLDLELMPSPNPPVAAAAEGEKA